jgi:hypothetical protein
MLTKTRTIIVAASLLLTVGIIWLMLRRSDKGSPVLSDPHAVSLEVRINHVEIRPTGDHAQLILTAVFDQSGQTPVRLEPPLLSLLTADGKPVAKYLGPMLPEPVLPGPDPAEISLHYWLPLSDLKPPLTLQASGRSYPVNLPDS